MKKTLIGGLSAALAGAAFALHAKIRKVSEKMYLIAPENVEVNMTSSVSRHY